MGKEKPQSSLDDWGFQDLAEWTGLEPATPGVTGRYSNRLNYHSASELLCPDDAGIKCNQTLATLRGFEPRYLP